MSLCKKNFYSYLLTFLSLIPKYSSMIFFDLRLTTSSDNLLLEVVTVVVVAVLLLSVKLLSSAGVLLGSNCSFLRSSGLSPLDSALNIFMAGLALPSLGPLLSLPVLFLVKLGNGLLEGPRRLFFERLRSVLPKLDSSFARDLSLTGDDDPDPTVFQPSLLGLPALLLVLLP